MASKLVALFFEAFRELDEAVSGLSPAEAVVGGQGESSFAWTYAHTTNQVDAWVNVRFARLPAHPLIGQHRFRVGGPGASAEDWVTIQEAVLEARRSAVEYLRLRTDQELETVIPYDGSFERLRDRGINLRYALMRATAHHYFHIGEIATKRRLMGHQVGDYPGLLESAV